MYSLSFYIIIEVTWRNSVQFKLLHISGGYLEKYCIVCTSPETIDEVSFFISAQELLFFWLYTVFKSYFSQYVITKKIDLQGSVCGLWIRIRCFTVSGSE